MACLILLAGCAENVDDYEYAYLSCDPAEEGLVERNKGNKFIWQIATLELPDGSTRLIEKHSYSVRLSGLTEVCYDWQDNPDCDHEGFLQKAAAYRSNIADNLTNEADGSVNERWKREYGEYYFYETVWFRRETYDASIYLNRTNLRMATQPGMTLEQGRSAFACELISKTQFLSDKAGIEITLAHLLAENEMLAAQSKSAP